LPLVARERSSLWKRLASVFQSALLIATDLRTSVCSITGELPVKSVAVGLLDLGQLVQLHSRQDVRSTVGDLVTLTLDLRNSLASTLESRLLRAADLGSEVCCGRGELAVDVVAVSLDWVSEDIELGCVEHSGGAVGDLVTLTLGLWALLWWWRWWWVTGTARTGRGGSGLATRDQRGSVVFGVLDAVADTIVGAAQDGVASSAFTGELTTSLSAADC